MGKDDNLINDRRLPFFHILPSDPPTGAEGPKYPVHGSIAGGALEVPCQVARLRRSGAAPRGTGNFLIYPGRLLAVFWAPLVRVWNLIRTSPTSFQINSSGK